jgi:hypothetical protein
MRLQAPFATSILELQRLDEAITGLTSALAFASNGMCARGHFRSKHKHPVDATTAAAHAGHLDEQGYCGLQLPPLRCTGSAPSNCRCNSGRSMQVRVPTSALAATIGSLAIKIGEDLSGKAHYWRRPFLGGLGLSASADTEDDGFFSIR